MVYVVGLVSIYDAGFLFSVVIALLTTGFILTNTISGFPNLGHTLNLGVGMIIAFIFLQITNTPLVAAIPVSLILTGTYSLTTYHLIFKRIQKPELASLAGLGLLFAGSNILILSLSYLRTVIDTTWWCGQTSMHKRFYESARAKSNTNLTISLISLIIFALSISKNSTLIFGAFLFFCEYTSKI